MKLIRVKRKENIWGLTVVGWGVVALDGVYLQHQEQDLLNRDNQMPLRHVAVEAEGDVERHDKDDEAAQGEGDEGLADPVHGLLDELQEVVDRAKALQRSMSE